MGQILCNQYFLDVFVDSEAGEVLGSGRRVYISDFDYILPVVLFVVKDKEATINGGKSDVDGAGVTEN